MYPYFIILLLVMILVYSNKSDNKYLKLKDVSLLLSMTLLIALAGLRAGNVGTDTNNYIAMFSNFQYETQSVFEMDTILERGYLFLQRLALFISEDYWSILTLIATLCVFCNFYVIKKLSINIRTSIFIYITLAVYVVFFNAARQGIAVAISAVSLLYIIKKDLIRFVICIFIASLFHRTVLIMVPFYFILRIPFTYKMAFLFSFIGLFSFYFFSKIITLFDTEVEARYAVYEDRGASGGQLLAIFFIIITLLLISFRKKISISNLTLRYLFKPLLIYFNNLYSCNFHRK